MNRLFDAVLEGDKQSESGGEKQNEGAHEKMVVDLILALAAADSLFSHQDQQEAISNVAQKAICTENFEVAEEAIGRIFSHTQQQVLLANLIESLVCASQYAKAMQLVDQVFSYTRQQDLQRAISMSASGVAVCESFSFKEYC